MELPLGTFGIAIAVVVLPTLSRKHAESSGKEFAETLDWAFRLICLIAIPSTIGLVLLAEPLLITLFQSENFTENDVVAASGSLRAYALGLLAFMAIKIFSPGYFSRQDTKTPVRIGMIAMLINMILNVVFYLYGMAHVGLALATSIAAFFNAGLLFWGLHKDKVFYFQSGWLSFIAQIFLANLVLVVFLLSLSREFPMWLSWPIGTQLLNLCMLVFGGVFVYVASLFLLGLRWRQIYR